MSTLEYISKFNENLKSKDSEILCNTVLNVDDHLKNYLLIILNL